MEIYPAQAHEEMPWANGQGTTWQVAIAAAEDGSFDWRLSFAAVVGETTFSAFNGVDRVIVLVEGEGLPLDLDGAAHELTPFVPLAFAGEAVVTCVAPAPTVDFNVMTRRGRYDVAVECVPVGVNAPQPLPELGPRDELFVVALEGSVAVHPDERTVLSMGPRDVARGPAREVTGSGTVAVVVLSRL